MACVSCPHKSRCEKSSFTTIRKAGFDGRVQMTSSKQNVGWDRENGSCQSRIIHWIHFSYRTILQVSISPTFYGGFYACRSQKRKKTVKLSVFFLALLGSAHLNALHKTLVKLTPDVPEYT